MISLVVRVTVTGAVCLMVSVTDSVTVSVTISAQVSVKVRETGSSV